MLLVFSQRIHMVCACFRLASIFDGPAGVYDASLGNRQMQPHGPIKKKGEEGKRHVLAL